jgi:hypothetical protein
MTTTAKKTVLKYRIKDILAPMDKYDRYKLQHQLAADLGCTYDAFYKMMDVSLGSTGDIRGGQLKIIATRLGCTVDELYTNVE